LKETPVIAYQINLQPDATIFQFIILTFIYSSTCFGHFPAHPQELNDSSGSLWFYLRIVVIAVLCSCSGRLYIYSDRGHHVEVLRMPRNINYYTGAFGDRVISWHWFLATSSPPAHPFTHATGSRLNTCDGVSNIRNRVSSAHPVI
jgi:hypothetical protein